MTKNIPTWLVSAIFIVSFLGFVDASFLTAEHFLKMTPPCFIVQGCDTVTTSSYSKILGVPVSLLGFMYYFLVLVLAMYYADKKRAITLSLFHAVTTVGFCMSLWFLYAQAFIIKAWCTYCLLSAGTSITLFILGIIAYYKVWSDMIETQPLS